jgi:NAD(P)-dependent dehydrogenase (short-subunit alcohol dehydrogenase family)
MEQNFTDQVVLIINAADDLGRAYCRYFLARGASLVLHDGRDDCLSAMLDELDWHRRIVAHSSGDLAVPGAADAFVSEMISEWGKIDILINNRGPEIPAILEKCSAIQLQNAMQSHLLSTMLTTLAVLPHMRGRDAGRIIATASGAGAFGAAGYTAQSAAGAGVIGFMRSLSLELSATSLKVNTIAPMTVEDHDGYLPSPDPMIDRELYHADKVAPVVAFLASLDCPLNGRLLSITGGRVAHVFASTVSGYFSHDLEGHGLGTNLSAILDTNYSLIPESAADELLMINV